MFSFESTYFRVLLATIAILLIGGTLLYSNYLAETLQQKERHTVELWGRAIQTLTFQAYTPDENSNEYLLQEYQKFIFNIVKDSSANIPRILGDDKGKPADGINLKFPPHLTTEKEKQKWMEKELARMQAIEIEYGKGRFLSVYYGESDTLKQLRWYPYLQVLVATIFIGLILIAFNVAKRNEQSRIWAGLAKETAHQLGTPVSSLMAWMDYLKAKAEGDADEEEIMHDMEADVIRLQNIAERFSKIGAKPELKPIPIVELLEKSANYMQRRMPKKISLSLTHTVPDTQKVALNPQLFEWVIENIMKNALDAMENEVGSIVIETHALPREIWIDIADTGKGMPRNLQKKIFQPGFTTKKRGWGLGLSLCKRIIEEYHKGQIFVKESEIGKGTTFRIVLPI